MDGNRHPDAGQDLFHINHNLKLLVKTTLSMKPIYEKQSMKASL